jgi:Uncharacterized protein conserved in bacteria
MATKNSFRPKSSPAWSIWLSSLITFVVAVSLFTEAGARGDDARPATEYLSVVFENDVFFQEDGGYTNGFGIALGKGTFDEFDQDNTPAWLLPLVKLSYLSRLDNRKRAISYLFGQVINTPEDIESEDLLSQQQPYSGALLWRANFYAVDTDTTDRIALHLGVVGPSAKAEESQKLIHKLTSGTNPRGWAHQLNDEPVVRLEFAHSEKLWQRSLTGGLGIEFIGSAHGGVGNLRSDIGAGAGFRWGNHLAETVHTATDLPGREVNPIAGVGERRWLVFVEVLGRYVFNDIFIEGNSVKSSHGVPLIHEQLQFSYGISFNLGRWAFIYSGARATKSYKNQPASSDFGAIGVTYRF